MSPLMKMMRQRSLAVNDAKASKRHVIASDLAGDAMMPVLGMTAVFRVNSREPIGSSSP